MAEPGRASLLIQFARAPVEGQVKTRMMPHLDARAACELHRELVLWTTRTLLDSGLGDVQLAVNGNRDDPLFDRCRALGDLALCAQQGSDLGERMHHALQEGLRHYGRVVLVGSDCPSIERGYLESALCALDRDPFVIGPALDGGYVLIGASQPCGALFEGVDWGSDRVYAQTLDRLRAEDLGWGELPVRRDVDRPEDLAHWLQLKSQHQ
jgi:rSAM/selenodomain-associated transferase 1